MVRVVGPLMSMSASGNFRGVMEFRTGSGKSTVTAPRQVSGGRTAAQQSQNAAFSQAIEGWRTLDESTKDQWRTAATGTGNTGYRLYLSEWFTQNISPPDHPAIPV